VSQVVQTRPLEPADLSGAARLLAATILGSSHYNAWAKQEEIADHSLAALGTKLEADPESLIGTFVNGELAGAVVSHLEAGLVWLGWIVVGETYRGQGLSHDLMRAFDMSARGRGAHKIWCDSRVGNTASQHLLETHGYRVAVTLECHWYGLDYFLWEKLL
jgi:RimJ/RimL family protein N-acetyltransferase